MGALWTPPYWDYDEGHYRLHSGYWAPHIGYYGGINYGFGYTGRGYYGGYWNNGNFRYNRGATNVGSNVRNVYQQSMTNNINNTRISYNGGRGGVNVRPTAPELAAFREHRTAPLAAQVQNARQAAANRNQFASANHGRPAMVAAASPIATPYRAPAPREVQEDQARRRAQAPTNERPGAGPKAEARNAANQTPPQRRFVRNRSLALRRLLAPR